MEIARRLLSSAEPIDWEQMIVTQFPRVFNYFRYQGMEDAAAEDLASVTIEKAWRSQSTYQCARSTFSTWLMTIARRTLIDYFRSAPLELPLDSLQQKSAQGNEAQNPEALTQQHEALEQLRLLLLRLPDRERELVALKYGAEMTNRAIAKMTGLSESNIGTILHRVVASLRKQMEGQR